MRSIIAIITIIGVISGFQLLAFAQGTENFEKRYEDSLIERRSFSEDQQHLERRFGIFAALKLAFKGGKAIASAIHNRKHHRRSYDELLEERDQLFELRDHLQGAHSYLAKRSDYDSLANDIVKRLVNQKRGIDYLLELNGRDLVERDVDVSISDLD
ncbi:hypothetical protein M378DRAFT_158164 [Amanita muscaria Koide BX008]|uniref:Uncharacterized protein n=1 Tax=Amanita muscaria (strain Koide BX008) TaxID=946122 RepID=A0A0C2SXY0_AMAMK|nr:hypothetical protein M378DRAFT_158164 [Amanita muscaria Koide BX008]